MPKPSVSLTIRSRMTNARIRFERNARGKCVFLGGSITAGPGWRDRVTHDIQSRFPNASIEFVNAGIPSLGSTPDAFRLTRDAFAGGAPDLLFIDAAVNDLGNGFPPVEQIRGMEGIVRHARRLNPSIDIVILHFAEDSMIADYDAVRSPQVIPQHERVAERYGLSTVNMPREMSRAIAAGEYTLAQWGELHPTPFGHGLYAAEIGRLLDEAWSGPLASGEAITPHPLPDPLDPHSYFRGRLLGVEHARLGPGWTMHPNWRPTDALPTRPGFVDVPVIEAVAPGSTLTLSLQGNAIGLFVTSGSDAGVAEFSIDDGPFRTRELFTRWSRSLHLPWAVMLDADLPPGPHTLRLRPAETRHADSAGHALRVVHFLVNDAP